MSTDATPDAGASQTTATPSIQDRLHAFLGADKATEEGKAEVVKDTPRPEKATAAQDHSQPDSDDEAEADPDEEGMDSDPKDPNEADAKEEIQAKPKTLHELSETLGMTYEQLLDGIQASTNVDGEEGKVSLSKLIKSYQLDGSLTRKSMEMAEARKAFEQEAQSKKQQFDVGLNQLHSTLDASIKMFQGDVANVNWSQLQESDPVEYLNLRSKFEDRSRELLQHHQFVQGEEEKRNQDVLQKAQESRSEEMKKLFNAVPEWKDEKAAKAGFEELTAYLKAEGFSELEFNGLVSHKTVLAMRKAMKYDALQAKKKDVVRKISEAPKLSRSGASSGSTDNESASFIKLRGQLKADGKIRPGLLSRFAK